MLRENAGGSINNNGNVKAGGDINQTIGQAKTENNHLKEKIKSLERELKSKDKIIELLERK